MQTEYREAVPVPIDQLTPYEKNAKTHDERQIRNIAESIRRFTVELDPKYAQTIIDRWEAFTGEKAVRLT